MAALDLWLSRRPHQTTMWTLAGLIVVVRVQLMPSSKSASEPKPKLSVRLPLCRRITIAVSRRSCQNSSLGAISEKFVVQGSARVEFGAASDEIAEHQKWAVESWRLPTKSHPIRLGQISETAAALLGAYDGPEKAIGTT